MNLIAMVQKGNRVASMVVVERMQHGDWEDVRNIYGEGIAMGDATFEAGVPEWKCWDESHMHDCRLIAREHDRVVGWAALSPLSDRCVYAGVAEVSVYVMASERDRGIGKVLLQALIDESERAGIWTLQASVFPENASSRALHRACGFREVGFRERIGKHEGVWRDTILLERRSNVVGVES